MKTAKPSYLLPELRFPEFIGEPPWVLTPLQKLAKRITQRNTRGVHLRVLTNSAEHGVVDQREYFDRAIATNTAKYYIVETGDYVYNPRSSSTAPVGPISKNRIGPGVMSPLYTVFRFRSDANEFFSQYFKSSHWHEYLRRVSNSGARHDRMAVKNDDLMQMPIPTPTPREQQRIAECLGSLDDLIAAEDRKLKTLRRHKHGLLQQLFPKRGETVPRLRFDEFRGAGHWLLQPLSEIAELVSERVGRRKCVPMSVTTGVGLLSQEERFGRVIAGDAYKGLHPSANQRFCLQQKCDKGVPARIRRSVQRYGGRRSAQ